MDTLVLSLFPGIGFLDRAFEKNGFCIVRGPDIIWGGDIKRFDPPAGRFDGIIGGPPCQCHCSIFVINKKLKQKTAEDLIPEFIRVVEKARPRWFCMENVPGAQIPVIKDYEIFSEVLNNRELGEIQNRKRRFSIGFLGKENKWENPFEYIEKKEENEIWHCTILASGYKKKGTGYIRGGSAMRNHGFISWSNLKQALRLQGFEETFFDHTPFTVRAAWRLMGNGVPLPMGMAISGAIKKVLEIRGQTRAAGAAAVSDPGWIQDGELGVNPATRGMTPGR